MNRSLPPLVLLAVGALAGCDDDTTPPADLAAANDLAVASADAATMVLRGPATLSLGYEPNGLWWDAPSQTLYIASGSNQIVAWTDDAGARAVADLQPFCNGPGSLGQLVRRSDGTLLATVFGYGTFGSIVAVTPDGSASALTKGDPTRRRVGLTPASDGSLYDTWFTGDKTTVGGVAKVAADGTETDVVTGLVRPIGVLALGANLILSDQKTNALLQTPIAAPATPTMLATVPLPDLLTVGPGGALFAGGGDGVYRVESTGAATKLPETRAVLGVAYDADHRRLFVAQPDPDRDAGTMPVLRLEPIDN